jgi:NTP pyrophosphatase (non-canonical NTP hydrolase)
LVAGDAIIKELGDVMFYVTALANYYDSDLDEVLQKNVDKLNGREERGTLQGSGDER